MQKGFAPIYILIGILILGIIGGGAYYLGKTQIFKPQPPILQDKQNPLESSRACTMEAELCPDGSAVGRTGPNCEFAPCPDENKSDETANWKTYTNTKYGYSIKYPSNKFANCGGPGNNTNEFFLFMGGEGTRICNVGEEPTEFYIIIPSKPKDYQKSNYENCYSVKSDVITVSGETGVKYTNQIKPAAGDKECRFVNAYAKNQIFVVLKHDSYIYEIYFNNLTNMELKNQILSTFKFTN